MLTPAAAHEAVRRDWTRVLDALAPLPAERWATPTRCAGWAVDDLVRHAVWGTSMEADALRRARVGEPGSGEGDEPAPDAAPAALLAALRSSVADLVGELAGAGGLGDDAVLTIPFGPIPLGFGLDVFAMEAGVHADDVLDALGRDEPLGDEVVAATTTVLTAVLPVLAAAAGEAAEPAPAGTVVALTGPTARLAFAAGADGWEVAGPDAAPTARVTGRDDTAVLRFALGRLAVDDPRLEVRGAEPFKRWFPGP